MKTAKMGKALLLPSNMDQGKACINILFFICIFNAKLWHFY